MASDSFPVTGNLTAPWVRFGDSTITVTSPGDLSVVDSQSVLYRNDTDLDVNHSCSIPVPDPTANTITPVVRMDPCGQASGYGVRLNWLGGTDVQVDIVKFIDQGGILFSLDVLSSSTVTMSGASTLTLTANDDSITVSNTIGPPDFPDITVVRAWETMEGSPLRPGWRGRRAGLYGAAFATTSGTWTATPDDTTPVSVPTTPTGLTLTPSGDDSVLLALINEPTPSEHGGATITEIAIDYLPPGGPLSVDFLELEPDEINAVQTYQVGPLGPGVHEFSCRYRNCLGDSVTSPTAQFTISASGVADYSGAVAFAAMAAATPSGIPDSGLADVQGVVAFAQGENLPLGASASGLADVQGVVAFAQGENLPLSLSTAGIGNYPGGVVATAVGLTITTHSGDPIDDSDDPIQDPLEDFPDYEVVTAFGVPDDAPTVTFPSRRLRVGKYNVYVEEAEV